MNTAMWVCFGVYAAVMAFGVWWFVAGSRDMEGWVLEAYAMILGVVATLLFVIAFLFAWWLG